MASPWGGIVELKRKEILLLSYFRHNARLALTKISKEIGMPVSTIFDKLKKYEETIITKHTSLLDFNKLGYATRASIFLRTPPQNRASLSSFLRGHPSVNTVYRINNGYDFMIDGIFRTVQGMEEFLEHLEIDRGVTQKSVHFVIEEVSRERFMAEPKLVQ